MYTPGVPHGDLAYMELPHQLTTEEYVNYLGPPMALRPHALHPENLFHGMLYLCAHPPRESRSFAGHDFKLHETTGAFNGFSTHELRSSDKRWRCLETNISSDPHCQVGVYHTLCEDDPYESTARDKIPLLAPNYYRLAAPEKGGMVLAPHVATLNVFVLGMITRGTKWIGFPLFSEFPTVRTTHPDVITVDDHGLCYLYCGDHGSSDKNCGGINWVSKFHGTGRENDLFFWKSWDRVKGTTFVRTIIGPCAPKKRLREDSREIKRNTLDTPADGEVCMYYFSRHVPKKTVEPAPEGSLQAQLHSVMAASRPPMLQCDLAKKLDVSKGSLSKWLKETDEEKMPKGVTKAAKKYLEEIANEKRGEKVQAGDKSGEEGENEE